MTWKVLDLFCGAGGAAVGLQRAWPDAEIIGIDIKPMPRYPFTFVQGDALKPPFDLREFDFVWASPPCQHYSAMARHIHHNQDEYPDLLEPTRELLKQSDRPYVIENVAGAPLRSYLMLCGSMFGLDIIRHRYFESDRLPFTLLPPCDHSQVYDPWNGSGRTTAQYRKALGIDWMPIGRGKNNNGTLNQAIPPAYSEYIAKQIRPVEVARGEQN